MRGLFVFFFVLFGLLVWGHSDFVLTKECHMLRDGDVLERLEMTNFVSPKSGDNQILDLSNAKFSKRNRISIVSANDTFFGVLDGGTMCKYKQTDDGVLSKGYENRTILLSDSIASQIIRFPFGYGEKISSEYRYEGVYALDRQWVEEGAYFIEADARGIIVTPEQDTLRNVLRLHIVDRSWPKLLAEFESKSDSIKRDSLAEYKRDIFLWFVEGYRYPVVEKRVNVTTFKGKTLQKNERSYYYPPEEQILLAYDYENQLLRSKNENDLGLFRKFVVQGDEQTDSISLGDTYFTQMANEITIRCGVDSLSEIEIMLTDIQGRVFAHIPGQIIDVGLYSQTINTDDIPPGEYLLTVFINDDRMTKKIIKH